MQILRETRSNTATKNIDVTSDYFRSRNNFCYINFASLL